MIAVVRHTSDQEHPYKVHLGIMHTRASPSTDISTFACMDTGFDFPDDGDAIRGEIELLPPGTIDPEHLDGYTRFRGVGDLDMGNIPHSDWNAGQPKSGISVQTKEFLPWPFER